MKITWKKRCARLLGLVALLFGGLFLMRNIIVGPVLTSLASGWLGGRSGSLTVEDWKGSWFGSLELEGIQFDAGALGLPLSNLSGGRLVAGYSLAKLVRGDLSGLSNLEASAERVELDLTGENKTTNEVSEESSPGLPGGLPALSCRVGTLVLHLPDGKQATLLDASVQTEPRVAGDSIGLAIQGTRWDGRALPAIELRAKYRYGRLRIDELTAGALRIAEAELSFGGQTEERDTSLSWDVPVSLGSSQVRLAGSIRAGVAEVLIEGGDIELADLEPLLGAACRGRIEISGQASVPLEDPLSGEATLELKAGREVVDGRHPLALIGSCFGHERIRFGLPRLNGLLRLGLGSRLRRCRVFGHIGLLEDLGGVLGIDIVFVHGACPLLIGIRAGAMHDASVKGFG